MNKDISDPDQIAGSSEHSQQCALMAAVAQCVEAAPTLRWLFAIPNGGDRNVAVAANLKAEGVKSGVADLCLSCARKGYHGFFIEMKNAVGSQSPKQKEFQRFVESEGYLYAVFNNWRDALYALAWYLDIELNSLGLKWIGALDHAPLDQLKARPRTSPRSRNRGQANPESIGSVVQAWLKHLQPSVHGTDRARPALSDCPKGNALYNEPYTLNRSTMNIGDQGNNQGQNPEASGNRSEQGGHARKEGKAGHEQAETNDEVHLNNSPDASY